MLNTSSPVKRPVIVSASSDENINQEKEIYPPVQKQKKQRSISPKGDNPILKELQDEITRNQTKYVLTYPQLIDFLENSTGHKDVVSLSEEYTTNTVELITMLQNIHSLTNDRSIKNRLTRLIKKLQKPNITQDDNVMLEC